MNGQATTKLTQIAVAGTGSAGMKHLIALNKIDGVRAIAIPMRQQRRQELEDIGFDTAESISQAIKSGISHCVVATDSGSHLQDCNEAIDGGLHVLCEKPLTTNSPDAKKMRDKASTASLGLYVGCVLRFSESLNTFRQHLTKVGNLHAVRVEYQSYLPDWRPTRPYQQSYSGRSGEGGVLLDLTHEIDYTGWLFGWPDSIFARVSNLNRLKIDSDEIAEMSWQTSAGCMVSIGIDYLSRPSHRTIKASGENGTISWNWHTGTVEMALANQDIESWTLDQDVDDLFFKQAQSFLRATQKNHESDAEGFIATADDGYKAIAICDAACRSSEGRREENIEYQ